VTIGNRMSKRVLKLPEGDGDDDAPDRRADELRQFGATDSASLDIVKEVFAGTGLADDQDKVQLLLEIRGEVQRHWGAARDSFLAIGRALVVAEDRLTKFENDRLKAGMEQLFPFGDAVASQLRKVARAVDAKRIPEVDCPGSYSTAYQIAVLKPAELQLAIKRGLVRPNVTRKEIAAFRSELRHNPSRVNWKPTETERDRLMAREVALTEELAEVRRRIKELDEA
jgi:hypothetical protein